MRIDRWCGTFALLAALPLAVVHALPASAGFSVALLLLCAASVTLLAWIATDGARPTLVVGGALALCWLAARSQAEFAAAALACGATGFLLLKMKGRTSCAESSQP